MTAQRTVATVRHWDEASGCGVLDSAETPGGVWADAAVVEDDRPLRAGQVVHLEWEVRPREGFDYVATCIETDPALENPGG
ncbi:MAG: cold shock domain-containing protein [Actinomycetota bacterium]